MTALGGGHTGSGSLDCGAPACWPLHWAFCLAWAGSAGQPTTKADSAAPACLPRHSSPPGRSSPVDWTVILACFGSAHCSRWMKAGGMTAAAGTAAGFTTAFSIDASADVTGQAGVGVALSTIGWGLTLTAIDASAQQVVATRMIHCRIIHTPSKEFDRRT